MLWLEVSQPTGPRPTGPGPTGHLVHLCGRCSLQRRPRPQQRSTAGRVSWGPGAAVALRTIGQGAFKQLSVCHPAKPAKGRELGSVPNRWSGGGSAGEGNLAVGWAFPCAEAAGDTSTSIAPGPRVGKPVVLSSFCPQGLSVPRCLPLIPAPVIWLHPPPNLAQTPPGPHPPALSPSGTNTLPLRSTYQDGGGHTDQ